MMADGEEAQWIEWYETLEKPLYNIVYRWLWDGPESQDVVQEAFLRCWRIRERIEPAGFKALIYKTTLRMAGNRARRRRLWRFVPFVETLAPNSFASDGDMLRDRKLSRALDGLPNALRQVLLLREIGGLSYGEIAEIMDIKEGTVGSRRNRALALLRQQLLADGLDSGGDRHDA
jgi:RNA polymerase sigma factor (sigma-70 family)